MGTGRLAGELTVQEIVGKGISEVIPCQGLSRAIWRDPIIPLRVLSVLDILKLHAGK